MMSGTGGTTYSVKACDVSVNSRGVVAASNFRTVYSSTTDIIKSVAWCSSSSTGRLAFTTVSETGATSIKTVSENGGTPMTLSSQSQADSILASPTWSPDDSKIAVTLGRYRLLILSSSDGSILEDDDLTSIGGAMSPEWSRTGNTIAFNSIGTTNNIYYLDYGSGNGAYTQNAVGAAPTWSPNNASHLAYNKTVNGIVKLAAFGSTETTQTWSLASGHNDPVLAVKWRR